MAVKYPAQIDDTISVPLATSNTSPVNGFIFNRLREAVLSVETELGIKPSGTYTSVKGRLDYLENIVGNLQIISLDNDLGGTLTDPKVVGLQGKPVSSSLPNFKDLLFWDGITWKPQPIHSVLPAGTEPGQVLVWDGYEFITQALTQDSILPSYNFSIVSGTKQFLTLGESWQQGFNISLDDYPDTAILTDSMDGYSKDVLPEIISSGGIFCESDIAYSKNVFNTNIVYTITITSGILTKSVTNTLTWAQPVYCGLGLWDGYAESAENFIKNLDYKIVSTTKNHTFTVDTATNYRVYFACRTAFGEADFIINNMQGGFIKVLTIPDFDSGFGVLESYDLYESENAGLGEITLTVI